MAPDQPRKAKDARHNENKRNQEKPCPSDGNKDSPSCASCDLQKHIGNDYESQCGKCNALGPERLSPYGNDEGIVSEQTEDGIGKEKACKACRKSNRCIQAKRKGKSVPQPLVGPCAITKTADRLEPLPNTNDGRRTNKSKPRDNAHGRDSGVPKGPSCHIKTDRCKTCRPLQPLIPQGQRKR